MKLSPLVIKLNNLALYSSTSCALPYLSTYFQHYTNANFKDVGRVMLISSIFGMIFGLTLSSLADRYRAHRKIYLISLLLNFVSYSALLVPIFTSNELYLESNEDLATTPKHSMRLNPEAEFAIISELNGKQTNEILDYSLKFPEDSIGDQFKSQIDGESSTTIKSFEDDGPEVRNIWFIFVSLCIIVGSMSSTFNMNLSDSFSANIAFRCNRSYGSVRFWGAVGWMGASMALSVINDNKQLPFLAPGLYLYVFLSALCILMIACWPDQRPFDLASKMDDQDDKTEQENSNEDRDTIVFHFKKLINWTRNTRQSSRLDLKLAGVIIETKQNDPIRVIKANQELAFDTKHENPFRNIRRCSLAPLGDCHIVRQFELSKKTDSAPLFCFVTKIEPTADEKRPEQFTIHEMAPEDGASSAPRTSTKSANTDVNRDSLGKIDESGINFVNGLTNNNHYNKSAQKTSLSMSIQLRLVCMIATRNPLVLRFLFLFVINGFTVNMNWLYLFPYLRSLDVDKFAWLSAYAMLAGYFSETFFYYFSSKLASQVGHSRSLSFILLIYSLRYSLYLLFLIWPTIPLELIILVEFLQAFNSGWFNCVFNESSLEFALEASKYGNELYKMGALNNDTNLKNDSNIERMSVDYLHGIVKVTMLSIASCCFDGIGIATSSLVGGWIIYKYGFFTLWFSSALIAFSFGVINLLIDNLTSTTNLKTEERVEENVELDESVSVIEIKVSPITRQKE